MNLQPEQDMTSTPEYRVIHASETNAWNKCLGRVGKTDICQRAEYHEAYSTRDNKPSPIMWTLQIEDKFFCYPFMLSPVIIMPTKNTSVIETGFYDISSVYGYSGPLSNDEDPVFLADCWKAFDNWADKQGIIAEFIRFSPYTRGRKVAHPDTDISRNRGCAVIRAGDVETDLLSALPSKTRNMVRRAGKEGYEARELFGVDWIKSFRHLYESTMNRNDAGNFFYYDDDYYNALQKLPEKYLRLFGIFSDSKLISITMALCNKSMALYHLGASSADHRRTGAGNLALYTMNSCLLEDGIEFITVGGGRTVADDDPLFRFKKNNAVDVTNYFIGKRVICSEAYEQVRKIWLDETGNTETPGKLIFYR